jgi:tRNA/tmRNA/rRNA uracil-C5-methylase (TrmA/RlmC/RlmD family)
MRDITRYNARDISNARFIQAKTEAAPQSGRLDARAPTRSPRPARVGAPYVLRPARNAPPLHDLRLVRPATPTRACASWSTAAIALSEVQPLDMFPQTATSNQSPRYR